MAIKTYLLVTTATGLPVSEGGQYKRHPFPEGQQPVLAAAKGLRWVLDQPPPYDPETHRPLVSTPIAAEATEITYTLEVLPRLIDHRASERARLRTEAESLEKAGDQIGAIKLRLKALET